MPMPSMCSSITTTRQDPNSFSVSIYQDGSVRGRYHQVSIPVQSSDVFGLWGSRAATPSSPLLAYAFSSTKYYQEASFNTSMLMRGGQDAVFCSLASVACVPNTGA
jgi:hypothetical protein